MAKSQKSRSVPRAAGSAREGAAGAAKLVKRPIPDGVGPFIAAERYPSSGGTLYRPDGSTVTFKPNGTASTAGLLAERGRTHGDFTENAAIAQQIKAALAAGTGFERMNAVQLEAFELIASKLGRIAAGDPNHTDHWADIAGYAQLVVDRLPAEGE